MFFLHALASKAHLERLIEIKTKINKITIPNSKIIFVAYSNTADKLKFGAR